MKTAPVLILASTSPQRKILLEQLIPSFHLAKPNLKNETLRLDLSLSEAVADLAARKAASITWQEGPALSLGADTIIVKSGQVYGKAHSVAEARAMLWAFSGDSHYVITGVALHRFDTNQTLSFSVHTKVFFKHLSEEAIQAYLDTGEWKNRAGAYAIQGKGMVLTEKIIGSYTNVVGLPLEELSDRLKELGVDIYDAADA